MKRKDILKKLKTVGFEFKEGGRHTLVFKNDVLVTQVPRHKEINEITVKKILKDAEVASNIKP